MAVRKAPQTPILDSVAATQPANATAPGIARTKRPTSSDVARLAGVSRATVSYIMNDVTTASISHETRERVLEAVAKLNYHPHETARSLRKQTSRILNVAVPDAQNPHYLQIYTGIEAYARSAGYTVFLSITNFSLEEEKRCFEGLRQKRSDALILTASTGRALLKEMLVARDQGYIITTLSSATARMLDASVDSVVPEPQRGEELLIEHLAQLGHRRIGYIYGVATPNTLSDRLTDCLDVQRRLGLPIEERWIRRCGPALIEGAQATEALLADCPPAERPTALVVVNDLLALGTLSALWRNGLSVPDEMSVASFDNTQFASCSVPPLTTVDYDAYQLGAEAARLTIDRLTHPDREPIAIELPPRLIPRASTGPAPTRPTA